MAIYIVTGKLGSGKTLAAVGRIRDALRQGRRVATNLDLRLEKLLPSSVRDVEVIRLPDKPSVGDLDAIGFGQAGVNEDRNGLIVLDELGAWLNTRQWSDKGRQGVIDWLLHSRKKGWDVIFIIQHANMVDKQIREGLAEFVVTCRRMDRLRVPVLGPFVKLVTGWEPRPPKVHVGTVRYGVDRDALVVDRWWYRGIELYDGYDTRQVFTESYDHGVYTLLTPWHLVGRYQVPKLGMWARVRAWARRTAARPGPRPKLPWVEVLMRLPPDERVEHWHRLVRLGAF